MNSALKSGVGAVVASKRVRMAHLCIVGSHRINGVSQLHSDLMVKTIFAGFAKLTATSPGRRATTLYGIGRPDAAAKAFDATFDVDDSLVNEDESELPPGLLSAPAVAD